MGDIYESDDGQFTLFLPDEDKEAEEGIVSYPGAYSGSEEEDEVRRRLGLPTKKLLYVYKDTHDPSSKTPVASFLIEKEFSETEYWCVLRVTAEGGEQFHIHSVFFAEMQKAGFAEEASV